MIPNSTDSSGSESDSESNPPTAVLIVDDDATNRLILSGLLQAKGYRTFSASDGHQALRLMSTQRYWAVFVDIRMPGIDGFETIRRMRRMNYAHQPAATRVVGVSASIEKAVQAKAEGFDAFLAKPVQGIHLSAILEQLVQDELGLNRHPMITV